MKQGEVSVIFREAPAPTLHGDAQLSELWRDEDLRSWAPLEWPDQPARATPPSRKVLGEIRILVAVALALVAVFYWWLLDPERRGDPWLFWPFALILGYKSLWWIVEWLNYIRPRFSSPPPVQRAWTVDVMTTACPGEPLGMILRTLLAMKAIRYPHTNYLCDEGDDPTLRAFCQVLGIRHVTREVKTHAKAGNINNALAQATGEIVVILDPDHEPAPFLIDRVLGFFEDPKLGFVQSVQAYRNQKDSFVADGAAKQTYLFYGPVMIGMNGYGTTQAIGANCVFRRRALDSIGGHAPGLSEDMHTTMRLYSKGWQSVYLPEILTRGLVPSTLSAYCKQQVKWACGSMELLLQEYPKLFRGMTGWQRLHYFLAPLYFLRGFIDALNLAIPIASLVGGWVVVRMDLTGFVTMFLPLQIVATVIRQRTQRWAIEPSERGAHLIGGILGAGCWWVFMRGVLSAIFRIKHPYIPTPKDNEAVDAWALATPNLIVAGLSVAAVVYGLARDWTPFSVMMAGFALFNAAQLTLVALVGQQRTLQRLAYAFVRYDWVGLLWYPVSKARFYLHVAVLATLRERAGWVATVVLAAAMVIHAWPHRMPTPAPIKIKETGGFYIGTNRALDPQGDLAAQFSSAQARLGAAPRLIPLTVEWAAPEVAPVPWPAIREISRRGAVPLITWEPRATTFPELRDDPELGRDRALCAGIRDHRFDGYLRRFAAELRDFAEPVLIRFAPFPDQLSVRWSVDRGNTAEEYQEAWRQIVAVFKEAGAANVGWVWQPGSPAAIASYYPGESIVDWVGLTLENRGNIGGSHWRDFAELYDPYRYRIQELRLPVLLTGFNCNRDGGNRQEWLADAMREIAHDYPEIRGLLAPVDARGWYADPGGEFERSLTAALRQPAFQAPPPVARRSLAWAEQPRETVRTKAVGGTPGAWTLQTHGQDIYIRGVAYNPGHDWRDGNTPLSRRELEVDLAHVKEFGANTIRRYGSSFYDRNILTVSREQGLEVLYGFWFEHEVDYVTDRAKMEKYESQVIDRVTAFKDEPEVLAWSLGNEVWGGLKHHYAQPYLTQVRHAHIDFVEHLARRIHELDPQRPVFTAHEHSRELAGALSDFNRGAPSLDFTAVNSYYERQISALHELAARFDPTRPYLVSEFGPDGYWDGELARKTQYGGVLEPTTAEKVLSYERGWSLHTNGHRGANLGGIAYCWRDRLESTATWFGLCDEQGRPKASYLALHKVWTGQAEPGGPSITAIRGLQPSAEPGQVLKLQAITKAPGRGPLTYKWRIASESFDFKVGSIEAGVGAEAHLTLPSQAGTYRVYLEVNDGHVSDQTNFPIEVIDPSTLADKPTLPLDGSRVGYNP